MPIAVRDRVDLSAEGTLAYLCVPADPDRRDVGAALFLVNGRAEPLDFVFSRADQPVGVLWRPADARRKAAVALVRTLFEACPGRPDVLLARAEEVPSRIFSEDLETDVLCGRLSKDEATEPGANECMQRLDQGVYAFWTGAAPGDTSTARRLIDQLTQCGLLLEPFDRAAAGLAEALAQ